MKVIQINIVPNVNHQYRRSFQVSFLEESQNNCCFTDIEKQTKLAKTVYYLILNNKLISVHILGVKWKQTLCYS